jgi:trimethylamine---corrinoid protein Co-methyltransferase
MDAIREVGPGGHYLGCAHTQAHFREAFWRTEVLDYKPFETWEDEGGRDTSAIASQRVERLLASWQAPPIDPGVSEALADYVARKKAAVPDAFG